MKYLTTAPIDLGAFFSQPVPPSCGAWATFAGCVRNQDHGRPVARLYYEAYPLLAEKMLGDIVENAREKWRVHAVHLSHRLGWLEVGETAVAIAVASPHRAEAFAACRHIIDSLKQAVPIWKKEIYADGHSDWVVCTHA